MTLQESTGTLYTRMSTEFGIMCLFEKLRGEGQVRQRSYLVGCVKTEVKLWTEYDWQE